MSRAILQGLASGRVRPTGPMATAGRAYKEYDRLITPGASKVQEALAELIGQTEPGSSATYRSVLGDMAASPRMLNLLKAMPAAAAGLGGVSALDTLFGEETFANKGMDMLGMGAGYFGINRGVNALGGTTPAGKALAIAAGLGLGKMGSDATQGAIGGIF